MSWISSEETRAIKAALTKKYPKFKFSVTRLHHSSVDVRIMAGPLALPERQQLNHFYLESAFPDSREITDFLVGVLAVVRNVKPKEIVREDGDYGSIPNYYVNMGIGKWNKPYAKTGGSHASN